MDNLEIDYKKAVLTIATCLLLFSLLGFAVFFLPLLMGAFASKR